MAKLDRFEREVVALYFPGGYFPKDWKNKVYATSPKQFIKLLRRQHKAVLKMAGDINCQDMITRLNEYKR